MLYLTASQEIIKMWFKYMRFNVWIVVIFTNLITIIFILWIIYYDVIELNVFNWANDSIYQ